MTSYILLIPTVNLPDHLEMYLLTYILLLSYNEDVKRGLLDGILFTIEVAVVKAVRPTEWYNH